MQAAAGAGGSLGGAMRFLRVNPRAQAAMFGCLAVPALHLAAAR